MPSTSPAQWPWASSTTQSRGTGSSSWLWKSIEVLLDLPAMIPSDYDIHSSPWNDPPFLGTVNHLFRWMGHFGYVSHNQRVNPWFLDEAKPYTSDGPNRAQLLIWMFPSGWYLQDLTPTSKTIWKMGQSNTLLLSTSVVNPLGIGQWCYMCWIWKKNCKNDNEPVELDDILSKLHRRLKNLNSAFPRKAQWQVQNNTNNRVQQQVQSVTASKDECLEFPQKNLKSSYVPLHLS